MRGASPTAAFEQLQSARGEVRDVIRSVHEQRDELVDATALSLR